MAQDTRTAGFRRWRASHLAGRRAWPDVVLAGILALATFVVHDVGYMLSFPFWTDEAWVAISTRLPLSQITTVTASTPTGWTFLLRLVVVGGDERLRIVPLLFAALTVIAAYAYVRTLPWPGLLLGRLAAALAGVAALLTPSALVRDDLKQYTADAFLTLLILWCAARLESDWTRRRLTRLAVVVVVGFLFSAVGVFVGAATFAGLVLVALVGRHWTRAREAAIAGGAAGVLLIVIFLVLYRPGIVPGLNDYWASYYLPISQGWGPSWRFLQAGGQSMAGYLGTGSVLLALLLIVAGVITLVRLRRVTLAVIVPALLVEMIGLSAARQYPLFDLRTSHFLTTALAVTAAIGVAGLCTLLARVHVGVAAAAAAIVVLLFVQQVNGGIRAQNINTPAVSKEDLRTPALYLAQHLGARDIVVVNMLSSWGFAYYWPRGTPAIEPVTSNLQRFVTVFPDQPNILVAKDRTPGAVVEVMAEAEAAAAKVGPGARIWFLHQHTIESELSAYRSVITSQGLTTQNVIPDALDLLTRSG
ncbi:hypothetical protein ABIB25_003235 [Nakamurella sp. UYEF19]|uniref:hypothetical protein n=1 Tax=Nakamurella sp. UYEF19 TaxID=1756392 RepID=UPI003390DABC